MEMDRISLSVGSSGDDKELLIKAESVLNRIIDSQEANGYVGATAKSFRSPERPVRGMDAYELYFVFHAFITVYEETGDKKALTAQRNWQTISCNISDRVNWNSGPLI